MRPRLPLALLLCLALLAAIAGCKEDEPDPTPKLPAETQTGAGTLGFKIGDKIYVASNARALLLQGSDNTYDITSGNSKEDWGFRVGTDSLYGVGTYVVDTFQIAPFTVVGSASSFLNGGCGFYSAQRPNSGTLIITRFDPTQRIISGRFSVPLFSQICGEKAITDGRFDVKF
jgi:hypothetical protein